MLLSWCSTCLFSRRRLGPFALLVLSKSNQTELESNPNSFFSFLEIRLCCFTLVKMLRSSISACIWTNVSSLPQQWGPVLWGALTPQSKHSWGSSLFTFFTSLVRHQMDAEITVDVICTASNTFLLSKEAEDHLRNPNPSERAHLQE